MKKIMIEVRGFKKMGKMCDFAEANRDRFAPGTVAANALPGLISTRTGLNVLTAQHASLENKLRELLRTKLERRSDLQKSVESLYHTAHAISAEIPGFDDKFRMPLKSDLKLLNAARSAVQDAAPQTEIFVQHAMPSDFLDALSANIRKFEQACDEHASAKAALSVSRKTLQASLSKGLATAGSFDAIMRNTFRDDPVTLEAWKAACRIPRKPRQKKEAAPVDSGSSPAS